MALYSHNVSYVSRRQGRSIAAVSAYRNGEVLYDDYNGETYDYSDRQDVLYKGILLPPDAPRDFEDRQTLVSAINASERRSDARTAREIKIALPNDIPTLEEWVALVTDYISDSFVKLGMCADFAIHEGVLDERRKPRSIEPVFVRQNNPHAHILLTTRFVDRNGFAQKCRGWDKRHYVTQWRKEWADIQNKWFERLGLNVRVSDKSLVDQGIFDRESTKHLGPTVMALELRGIRTGRGDIYRETMTRNKERELERVLERQLVREREMERDREFERSR